jgi:predicted Rossmann fold nucleotide-binding protein DprA/Smf involved in DNA uptake
MILAIVGSRTLTTPQIFEVQTICRDFICAYTPDLVISGGAEGVDSIAVYVAQDLFVPFEEFLPEGKGWLFYKRRDAEMAEECDTLLMVRSRQSLTYGSGWTADYAESLGKPVFREYV